MRQAVKMQPAFSASQRCADRRRALRRSTARPGGCRRAPCCYAGTATAPTAGAWGPTSGARRAPRAVIGSGLRFMLGLGSALHCSIGRPEAAWQRLPAPFGLGCMRDL